MKQLTIYILAGQAIFKSYLVLYFHQNLTNSCFGIAEYLVYLFYLKNVYNSKTIRDKNIQIDCLIKSPWSIIYFDLLTKTN
jgi:hypothetical protein